MKPTNYYKKEDDRLPLIPEKVILFILTLLIASVLILIFTEIGSQL